MPAPGERLLAAEMIGCLALSWAAEVYGNRANLAADPLDAAPKPQTFLPIIGAYSALGLLALFGPQPARLAAGIGGLVAMVVILKAAAVLFPNANASPAGGGSGAAQTTSLFSAPTGQGGTVLA